MVNNIIRTATFTFIYNWIFLVIDYCKRLNFISNYDILQSADPLKVLVRILTEHIISP